MAGAPQGSAPLPVGSRIGIVGGGQLGRMLAQAAADLGFSVLVVDPDPDCPAAAVCHRVVKGAYDDREALALLARACDVVTFEFENVDAEALRSVVGTPVRPDPSVLDRTQDRAAEKRFLQKTGCETARWQTFDDAESFRLAVASVGNHAVMKTRRGGYDGHGQRVVRPGSTDSAGVLSGFEGTRMILEAFVPFEAEVSVIGVRGLDGATATYDPAENIHEDGILRSSTVPTQLPRRIDDAARERTTDIMVALDHVGVIGVEFFVVGDQVIANEFAPRVHNSGHWTRGACVTSQFENHIRAIAGWPLGSVERIANARMVNVLGREIEDAHRLAGEDGAALTLYGKREARDRRKMGHVVQLSARSVRKSD